MYRDCPFSHDSPSKHIVLARIPYRLHVCSEQLDWYDTSARLVGQRSSKVRL